LQALLHRFSLNCGRFRRPKCDDARAADEFNSRWQRHRIASQSYPTLKGSKKGTSWRKTLVSLMVHVIFSTKNREPFISPEIEPELFAYIGGILKNNHSRLLGAGGTADHVHLLISQSKNLALSALMKDVKKNSSSWIKTTGNQFRNFHWQDGYGAFSIGQSQINEVKRYLSKQKEHHRKKSFQEELIQFLKAYGIEYDERYVWN
jgi:REP-associated tyrosine transposase